MTWTFKLSRRIAASRVLSLATLGVATLLTACGADATGVDPESVAPTPIAGVLNVQLDTPSSNDGAIQFMVTGPGIDSMAANGYQGYGSLTATGAQLIVTGQIQDGVVARVHVRDVNRAPEFRVVILAAAARGSYQLQNLQGYQAIIRY